MLITRNSGRTGINPRAQSGSPCGLKQTRMLKHPLAMSPLGLPTGFWICYEDNYRYLWVNYCGISQPI